MMRSSTVQPSTKGATSPRVVAIIQSRMGSVRLPGKMLMPILEKPMIFYLFSQLKHCRELDSFILATSTNAENDPLADFASSQGVPVFRGSEDDVLSRFLEASRAYGADLIVRVTGDEPLIDPFIVDEAVRQHLALGADYTSTKIDRTIPQGLDVEIFSFAVLEKIAQLSDTPYEKEHETSLLPLIA